MQLARPRAIAAAGLAATALVLAACSSGSSGGQAPATSASGTPAAAPVCPLTGLPPAQGESPNRPALAVKVDNVSDALPQAGVNNADIVFEELVEGGLTRLMAIFQCEGAPTVGPIRSARITDAYLLSLLHGSVLAFSGANPKDLPPIRAHGDTTLLSWAAYPQYFSVDSSRPAPHDVFASTAALLRGGLKIRHRLGAPPPMFHYGPLASPARPAHRVSMSWPAASAVWTWSNGVWLRTQNGTPDRLTGGEQISATNVVVMSVNLASTGLRDIAGAPSPLDVTIGHNSAWVLRDGKIIRGTWTRRTVGDPITLTDAQGHPIALAPGRTWVELLPTPRKPTRG
jgi:hypothetical protein